MPGETRLGIADGLAMGVQNVGQEENVGIAGQGIRRPGTPFQGPKAPGEAQYVCRGEVLVAYDHDGRRVVRVRDGPERRLVDEPTFRAIEDAYNTHTVVVIRDQHLTPAHVLRFARRFGPLERSPRTPYALPSYPDILLLSNILDAHGQPIGNAEAGLTWHTDLSYTATPPRGSLLYAVEVPTTLLLDSGGLCSKHCSRSTTPF